MFFLLFILGVFVSFGLSRWLVEDTFSRSYEYESDESDEDSLDELDNCECKCETKCCDCENDENKNDSDDDSDEEYANKYVIVNKCNCKLLSKTEVPSSSDNSNNTDTVQHESLVQHESSEQHIVSENKEDTTLSQVDCEQEETNSVENSELTRRTNDHDNIERQTEMSNGSILHSVENKEEEITLSQPLDETHEESIIEPKKDQ